MLSMRDAEIAMTTNRSTSQIRTSSLSGGLDRVTSLDAIDESTFDDYRFRTYCCQVAGVEAAESVGLGPVKIIQLSREIQTRMRY